MDSPKLKPNQLRNIIVRIFTFAFLVIAVRFAYVITIAGESCGHNDFCFFPENLGLLHHTAATSSSENYAVSALYDELPRDELWRTSKKWRRAVDYYSAIFQDLIAQGLLSSNSKTLCVGSREGEDVLALKENGVVSPLGISEIASPPLTGHVQPFDDSTFDFEFAANPTLDRSTRPADFAREVCRTLKPGGVFVAHILPRDNYSFNSFLDLFNCFRLIHIRDLDGLDTTSSSPLREIVLKKETNFRKLGGGGSSGNNCRIQGYKREFIRKAEPLIEQEPLKPWIALKRNMKKVKYLSSMADISFKQRYVYVDVGARSYGWFKKQYPKQNKSFEVYAIEADRVYHEQYRNKKGVKLLPYAAWVRNETLFFEITRNPGRKDVEGSRGMGRIVRTQNNVRSSSSYGDDVEKIRGFDFVEWVERSVSESDFVVVKMDVEGAEFHLVPRLIESGAICLIDEVFLECHYNRWQRCCPGQRSAKFDRSYGQCLELFNRLREAGVLVHQWW